MTSRNSDRALTIRTRWVGKIGLVIPTRITSLAGVVALVALTAGVATPDTGQASSEGSGIHKIKHVVVIMQENRSFDSYFGTYPGPTASRRQAASRRRASRTRRPASASSRTSTTPT